MLVEQRPEGFVCDREAIAAWLGWSPATIAAQCVVVDRTRTGRALYNYDHCLYVLGQFADGERVGRAA